MLISIALTVGIIIGYIINNMANKKTSLIEKHVLTTAHHYEVGQIYYDITPSGWKRSLIVHVESDKIYYSVLLETIKSSKSSEIKESMIDLKTKIDLESNNLALNLAFYFGYIVSDYKDNNDKKINPSQYIKLKLWIIKNIYKFYTTMFKFNILPFSKNWKVNSKLNKTIYNIKRKNTE